MSIPPMNHELSLNLNFATLPQSQPIVNTAPNRDAPQTLDDALDSLVRSMTSEGKVDRDHPLVKMLAAYLQQVGSGGDQGASQDSGTSTRKELAATQLEDALREVLEHVLGKAVGISKGSSGPDQDIVSKLIGGLVQHKLNSILHPSGNGCASFSQEDSGLVREIAQFMDQHPEIFGSPDNANGNTYSWSDEVDEDHTLNSDEAGAFQQAIHMITQSLTGYDAPSALGDSRAMCASSQGSGEGLSGGSSYEGYQSSNDGALAGSNINVTMSADEFLQLMKASQGHDAQGAGATAQSLSFNEDVSQAAAAIINAMFG
jgi:hypothetical protein